MTRWHSRHNDYCWWPWPLKQQFLCNSRFRQSYEPSQLKVLAVNGTSHPADIRSYTSFICFYSHQLKVWQTAWAPLLLSSANGMNHTCLCLPSRSPDLVASYDIQPGNGVGLFWDTKHTYLLTYFPQTHTASLIGELINTALLFLQHNEGQHIPCRRAAGVNNVRILTVTVIKVSPLIVIM